MLEAGSAGKVHLYIRIESLIPAAVTRWMLKIILYSEGIVRLSKSYLKPSLKNVDDRIQTLADTYLQIHSQTPYHWPNDCSWRTSCNLCEEHVNIISTVTDPDPNPMIGDQLPHPNECNAALMSGTRGETLTPNPNECHSMLTSATGGYTPVPISIYTSTPFESSMVFCFLLKIEK